jgi:hypothetical protein
MGQDWLTILLRGCRETVSHVTNYTNYFVAVDDVINLCVSMCAEVRDDDVFRLCIVTPHCLKQSFVDGFV